MSKKKIIVLIVAACLLVSLLICIPDKLKININQPSDQVFYSELVDINGIGPITAERAVTYRRYHKPIKVNDLDNVKGIGEYRLKLIKSKFKD